MAKSIRKNYIYNLIYQLLIIILPLITTPYLSRVLHAEGIGIYSYTLSIVTYFALFGSLGISMYGQREIAYIREDKTKVTTTFYELLFLRFITMTFSIIVFIAIFTINNEYSLYYKILILELFANLLDISWFFQGLEEFKKTVFRNMIVKLLSVICIFIFIKDSNDVWIYVLIYACSNLFGNLSLWLYLPKYINKLDFKSLSLKKHIKPTIGLFIPQIAMQIYLVLDKTMLGYILNDMSEIGNYDQSQKIVRTALSIITALGTVVAPRIANIISKGNEKEVSGYLERSFRFVWFLGFPMMLGLIAVSNTIIPWFLGEGYDKTIILMKYGSLLILAIGLNNVTGIQYLIPAKKQSKYTKSVVIAAILNFTLNLILIPKFKSIGAIMASVIAEFSIFFIQLIDVKKDFKINIIAKNSFKYIVSAFIMFIVAYYLGFMLKPTIITTIIQISIACIIYFILLLILKDNFVYEILNMIKLKRRK